ncbi:carbohydrate-binding protein [Paenibacillus kobensis]|uniref:hypothetical protein n=1 Tax=Paenibacillus kobensis TaxID=59841 RepID=UPI0013E2A244|nr:hypothetical protein [Paenibacillus kobensis]
MYRSVFSYDCQVAKVWIHARSGIHFGVSGATGATNVKLIVTTDNGTWDVQLDYLEYTL